MTHLPSDVLSASTVEQPKLPLPRGQRIVRRPVKALLGVVLIGSAVGLGGLIVGRSATPGIDQSAQVNPATAQSSSVAAGMYQPGALAGYAPEEAWRAAEAGALAGVYQPSALAGEAPVSPETMTHGELPYYADEDGAGFGYLGDGFGHRVNGFTYREPMREVDTFIPEDPSYFPGITDKALSSAAITDELMRAEDRFFPEDPGYFPGREESVNDGGITMPSTGTAEERARAEGHFFPLDPHYSPNVAEATEDWRLIDGCYPKVPGYFPEDPTATCDR